MDRLRFRIVHSKLFQEVEALLPGYETRLMRVAYAPGVASPDAPNAEPIVR